MMRSFVCTLVLVFAASTSVSAQQLRPFAGDETTPTAPTLAASDLQASDAAQRDGSSSTARHVLHAIGGAAVGAWVGYLVSQVQVGSWDEQRISREGWAAGGAALGLTLGLTIPAGGVGSPSRGPFRRVADRESNRKTLTGEQIRKSQAGDLYAIIRSLRPEWLQTRGTGSMRETPRGEASGTGQWDINVTPGIATIKIYLDEVYMGGVGALHSIDPGIVGQVRFLDSAEATQKFGGGHLHGAIHVIIAPAH